MLQGDTRNLPLQNICQTLSLNQQEGILTVISNRMERALAIRSGTLSFLCARPYQSQLLQEILVRLKTLTAAEYENVFSTASGEQPPGDVLLDRHVLQPDLVSGPIREQFLERLYEIFEWKGARYRFEVRPIPEDRKVFSRAPQARVLEFPIDSVLMEVARREDEWELIRQDIPHSNQIYRVANASAGQFHLPDFLDEDRFRDLLKLLDGERTLDGVLEATALPPFFVFCTVRQLIQDGFLETLTLEEKKKLAERQRKKYQIEELVRVYESILSDNPRELETRKKLVHQLEKQRARFERLKPHYWLLAESALEAGDLSAYREHLERILSGAPENLDAMQELVRISAEDRKEKDYLRILGQYLETIRRNREYERGATFLASLFEIRREDATLFKEAAHLFLLCGNTEEARKVYQQAAKIYAARGEFKSLRIVITELRGLDPKTANRWQKLLHEQNLSPGKKGRLRKAAIIASFLITLLLGGGYLVYEWDVNLAYAEVLQGAQKRARQGDLDEAKTLLLEFKEQHPYSFVARRANRDLATLRPADDGQGNGTKTDPVRRNPDNVERLLTRAAGLKQRGDYAAAYGLLKDVNAHFLTPTLGQHVVELRENLRLYLEGSSSLWEQGRAEETKGNLELAHHAFRRIVDEFPFSPEAKRVSLPVLLNVIPAEATVSVDGRRLASPPYIVQVPPSGEISVSLQCPTFAPRTLALDASAGWQVLVSMHKLASWVGDLEASVESEPVTIGALVVCGARGGELFAFDSASGELAWTFKLDGLGDPRHSIRSYRNDAVFASTEGAIYRVSCQDGSKVFRFQLPRNLGGIRGELTPPDDDGLTHFMTSSGQIVAVDLDGPEILWSRRTLMSTSLPLLRHGQRVYVAGTTGRVQALDAASGESLWTADLDDHPTAQPAVMGGFLYVAAADKEVHVVSVEDGKVRSSLPLENPAVGRVLAADEALIVLGNQGELTRIHVPSGRVEWQITDPGDYARGPLLAGDKVLTQDEEGTISAYGAADGVLTWKYFAGSPPASGLASGGNLVFIGDTDGGLHAISLANPRAEQ